jgi:hypothetical protein
MPRQLSDNRISQRDGQRLDHTPGRFEIKQSPFRSASHLIAALITKRNEMWRYQIRFIGGQGNVPCAVQDDGAKLEMLWQDATGRWWMQHEVRTGVFLPNIDATLALVERPELGDDTASMNAGHISCGGLSL